MAPQTMFIESRVFSANLQMAPENGFLAVPGGSQCGDLRANGPVVMPSGHLYFHLSKVLEKAMQKRALLPVILPFVLVVTPFPLTAAERDQAGDALGRALKARAAESTSPGKPAVRKGDPCAGYGAGFVRLEGSSTCVRLGGNVRVEVGGQR